MAYQTKQSRQPATKAASPKETADPSGDVAAAARKRRGNQRVKRQERTGAHRSPQ